MTSGLLNSKGAAWIASSIGLILFLATNLPWQLDDYDQAKQAYTSFEMVKEGHWLYQHTPHERIATKPPLVGWISAGIFSVTRSWAVAWRLPSLLSAIALSILLFRAGSVYGAVGGLISLSAFAFNLLTPRLATLVRTDMPLALVIFATGFLIWDKIRKREPWSARDRLSIFALLTAAMLIKGPIVYAFLLPGIVGFEIWNRRSCSHGAVSPCDLEANIAEAPRRSEAATPPERATSSWCGWRPWIISLAIFLVWVIGGSIFVPGFYDQVVVREFLGRFGETVHRPQPFLFYFPHLLHKFFPWSVLMIACAIFEFIHLRELDGLKPSSFRKQMSSIRVAPETLWLICWIFGGLIVMSIIPSKRVDRIFPIIPPLCLLLAAQIGNLRSNEQLYQRVLRWSAAALFLSIFWTGGYAASKIVSGYRDRRDALVVFAKWVQEATGSSDYEILKSSDEGLLLYFNRMHFVDPERAVAQWHDDNRLLLVTTEEEAARLLPRLGSAKLAPFKSFPRKDGPVYVLITHKS